MILQTSKSGIISFVPFWLKIGKFVWSKMLNPWYIIRGFFQHFIVLVHFALKCPNKKWKIIQLKTVTASRDIAKKASFYQRYSNCTIFDAFSWNRFQCTRDQFWQIFSGTRKKMKILVYEIRLWYVVKFNSSGRCFTPYLC